jgi:hypothetical protein
MKKFLAVQKKWKEVVIGSSIQNPKNLLVYYKMFDIYMSIFVAVLFFLLTPGILLSLPSGATLSAKAATHAIVFAVVFHFTNKFVTNYFYGGKPKESFYGGPPKLRNKAKPIPNWATRGKVKGRSSL